MPYPACVQDAAAAVAWTRPHIADRTHGSIAARIAGEGDPARLAILEFIKRPPAPRP